MSEFFGPGHRGNSSLQKVGGLSLLTPAGNTILVVTQTAITLGNSTDNPSIALAGAGSVTISGPMSTSSILCNAPANGQGLIIRGPGAGAANIAYIAFQDVNSNRTGYVGDGGVSSSDIFLESDSGNVSLQPGGVQALYVGSTQLLFGDSRNQSFVFQGTGAGVVNGFWTFNAPTGQTGIEVFGAANVYSVVVVGSGTSLQSYGLLIQAGTSTDLCFNFQNRAGTLNILRSDGGGNIVAGNANFPNIVANGVFAVFAGPNNAAGSFDSTSATFLRLSTSGTEYHYFGDRSALSGGTALDTTVRANNGLALAVNSGTEAVYIQTNGLMNINLGTFITNTAGNYGLVLQAPNSANNSFGAFIRAGTSTSDVAVNVSNAANNTAYLRIFGDGSTLIGNPSGGTQGLGSLNAQALYIQGVAVGSSSSGSFTGTFTGVSGSPTGTVFYSKTGNTVTLTIPVMTMSGTATTFTMTGLPGSLQPGSVTQVVGSASNAIEDGGVAANTAIQITAGSGTVTFLKQQGGGAGYQSSNWTSGSTARDILNPITITYLLN